MTKAARSVPAQRYDACIRDLRCRLASVRRSLDGALRFGSLRPPGEIVGEAGERLLERRARCANGLGLGVVSLIGPTASVLETTTMPISDNVPCHMVHARAPDSLPAE
jgi:hypothetical protein